MIKIKVPASTANIGAGFDCFGMALNLYNEFEIGETKGSLTFLENGKPSSIMSKDNLIYLSMMQSFRKYGHEPEGLYINVTKANVPVSRGLGSSAACIAAGLLAANCLMDNIMTEEEMLNMAASIEGHPDNVVPAIKGGFDVSMCCDGNVIYSKIDIPKDLSFAALIPDFKMDTLKCRKILPQSYSREDCIFNISRASLLICSLWNRDFSKLKNCFEDKIHQPYRGALIEDLHDIFKKADEFGSLGQFISGSGSTLMAVIEENNTDFCEKMSKFLPSLKANWQIKLLKPDYEGAKVIL